MARKVIIEKKCTKTGEVFSGTLDELTEFFYRDKSQKDGLSSWSKEAERAYNKAYTKGLKVAKVERKSDIEDDAVVARFEKALKPERVARRKATKAADAKAKTPARTTARRKARSTKKAEVTS